MSVSLVSSRPGGKPQLQRPICDPAGQLLARVQTDREVVQEAVFLARSLEWDLGQEYLRSRGAKAFTSDNEPVPFVVNNDGSLSRKAAELVYEGLEASREEGEIYVLELGVGVGLFARFFLDHFRDLARKHDNDYYDRLCYILADRSQRMLLDVARQGILADHAGHCRFRVVDALKVDEKLPLDVAFSNQLSAFSNQPSATSRGEKRCQDPFSLDDGAGAG